MPNPMKGETEKEFLKRCIPTLIREGREQRQAIAICYSIYRRGQKPLSKKRKIAIYASMH